MTLPFAQTVDGNGRVLQTPEVKPLKAESGNVAAAPAIATLEAAPGVTTYISGFEITGSGATVASVVTATVTGCIDGTLSYNFAVPAGVTTGCTPLIIEFTEPLPASGPNVPIVVSLPSLGAGNTNATVTAHGFQR